MVIYVKNYLDHWSCWFHDIMRLSLKVPGDFDRLTPEIFLASSNWKSCTDSNDHMSYLIWEKCSPFVYFPTTCTSPICICICTLTCICTCFCICICIFISPPTMYFSTFSSLLYFSANKNNTQRIQPPEHIDLAN